MGDLFQRLEYGILLPLQGLCTLRRCHKTCLNWPRRQRTPAEQTVYTVPVLLHSPVLHRCRHNTYLLADWRHSCLLPQSFLWPVLQHLPSPYCHNMNPTAGFCLYCRHSHPAVVPAVAVHLPRPFLRRFSARKQHLLYYPSSMRPQPSDILPGHSHLWQPWIFLIQPCQFCLHSAVPMLLPLFLRFSAPLNQRVPYIQSPVILLIIFYHIVTESQYKNITKPI